MSNRNTLIRSMHDLGLAAWFGGSLMGAIGLNGAANVVKDKSDRTVVASAGWARWAPVNAVAIGVHAVGGIGLILANKGRLAGQTGVAANTIVKAALTLAAVGSTVYSGIQGKIVADAGAVPADGGVIPAKDTPKAVATAQQQLRITQWVTPAATAGLVILASQQGEQQRPVSVLKGLLHRG